VPWSADYFAQTAAAGTADVHPTPDELHLIYRDFAGLFNDVRLQIVDMPLEHKFRLPPYIIVSGTIGPMLAARQNAIRTDSDPAGD
jgi:hypothetical protein